MKNCSIYKRFYAFVLVFAMLLGEVYISPVIVDAVDNSYQGFSYAIKSNGTTTIITENGDLYCCGENNYGQVGNGKTGNQTILVKVQEDVANVYPTGSVTGAIKSNGDLYLFGRNNYGQIGIGTTSENVSTPTKVMENVRFFDAAFHSIAITINDDLYCWGYNDDEVGNNTKTTQLTPTKILSNVKSAVATRDNVYALTNSGELYAWGHNGYGQVGNGVTPTFTNASTYNKPYKVLDNVKEFFVDSYGYAVGAINYNGDLYEWGWHTIGGTGSYKAMSTPVKILEDVKTCDFTNDYDRCAITNNGDLYCWGYNKEGQVGVGYITDSWILEPQKVLSNIRYANAHIYSMFAISQDNKLYSWGKNNYGQVGDGTQSNVLQPKIIMEDVKEIVGKENRVIALKTDNSIYTWGYGQDGSIGNGSNNNSSNPVKVMDNISYICKNTSRFVVTMSGDVYVWGYNRYGQLGVGNSDNQSTPCKIMQDVRANISNVTAEYCKESIPKLTESDARTFLAFLYDSNDVLNMDLSNDENYKLLTGDYGELSADELSLRINAFSIMARSMLDKQTGEANKITSYCYDELLKYFEKNLGGMREIDEQIIGKYKGKAKKYLEKGISDILASEIANYTGVFVTETTFENAKFIVDRYTDLTSIPEKVEKYVDDLVAIIQGAYLVRELDVKGRTSYFVSYLNMRDSFESADDPAFEFAMESEAFILADNTYLSNVWDLTTGITGKDSWDKHTNELNRWAEFLYNFERCNVYHDYNVTDSSTCDLGGIIEYSCKKCGHVRCEKGSAFGHIWDEGVVIKQATCEEKGIVKYTCINDESHKMTMYINKTGHIWGERVTTIAPTCEKKGESVYICINNPSHKKIEEIDAIGHDWETDYTVDVVATYDELGKESIHCKNCDVVKDVRDIPKLIHDSEDNFANGSTGNQTGNSTGGSTGGSTGNSMGGLTDDSSSGYSTDTSTEGTDGQTKPEKSTNTVINADGSSTKTVVISNSVGTEKKKVTESSNKYKAVVTIVKSPDGEVKSITAKVTFTSSGAKKTDLVKLAKKIYMDAEKNDTTISIIVKKENRKANIKVNSKLLRKNNKVIIMKD